MYVAAAFPGGCLPSFTLIRLAEIRTTAAPGLPKDTDTGAIAYAATYVEDFAAFIMPVHSKGTGKHSRSGVSRCRCGGDGEENQGPLARYHYVRAGFVWSRTGKGERPTGDINRAGNGGVMQLPCRRIRVCVCVLFLKLAINFAIIPSLALSLSVVLPCKLGSWCFTNRTVNGRSNLRLPGYGEESKENRFDVCLIAGRL